MVRSWSRLVGLGRGSGFSRVAELLGDGACWAQRLEPVHLLGHRLAATASNPEYCLVVATLTTSGEGAGIGSAGVQVQLPANWNNKLLFNGVGGLAGSFNSSANPVDLTLFLAKGYAAGVTDTGHVNTNLS
ncbi:MAG: tannase/feruloyl esterase family alpha/beta hydrolase, partial [Alphaproteobacteria bacterium]|nr:tannase/feruloyl esterase family alpha/beta hydrolase [Alphaproteobacteria bacterium]